MFHTKFLFCFSFALIGSLSQAANLTIKPEGKSFTPEDLKSPVVMYYVQAFGAPEVSHVFPGTLGGGVTIKFPEGTAWNGMQELYRYVLRYHGCSDIKSMQDTFHGTIGRVYVQGQSSKRVGEPHPNDLLILQTYTRDSKEGSKSVHEYDFVLFVYSDKKVNLKDAAQCKKGDYPTKVNMQLTLQKGWNAVWVMGKQVVENKDVVLDSYVVRNFQGTALKGSVPFRNYPNHENP